MKLTWQPIDNEGENDGRPVILADTYPTRGPGSKIVVSSSIQHGRSVEAVQYPRAESAEFFDRGNRSTTFSALVIYEFSSVQECSKFISGLGDFLSSGRGHLTLTYADGGSDRIPRCVWSGIATQPKVGVSVMVPYTFTGGAMSPLETRIGL